MKYKILMIMVAGFTLAMGYKVFNNLNKKRGMTKTSSDRFVKNFGKLMGTKKMDARENPDEEINAMIEASGNVSDFEIQMGDDKINCVTDMGEESLKEMKKARLKLFRKCRDEECTESDHLLLNEYKSGILDCLRENELGQED